MFQQLKMNSFQIGRNLCSPAITVCYSISYAVSGLGVTKFVDTKFALKTLTLSAGFGTYNFV